MSVLTQNEPLILQHYGCWCRREIWQIHSDTHDNGESLKLAGATGEVIFWKYRDLWSDYVSVEFIWLYWTVWDTIVMSIMLAE